MKRLLLIALFMSCFGLFEGTAEAWYIDGKVYCDANNSGKIEATDPIVIGARVRAVGVDFQFSLEKLTDDDGFYSLFVANVPQTYDVSVVGATAPVIFPATVPVRVVTSEASPDARINFLLAGSACGGGTPRLTVVKTPDDGVFAAGSAVSFSIVVANDGSAPATNARLHDQLPGNGGLTWTAATTSQGTCGIASNVLDCEFGTIQPGIAVTVTVSSPSTTPAGACQLQPNPVALATADGGLQAQDAGSMTCTPPVPGRLTVNKTPDTGTFAQGSQLTFTIVVGNDGGSPATNTRLVDQLPGNGGLVWTTATATQGSCTLVSNLLDCSLGTIPVNGSVMVVITSTQVTPNAVCQLQSNPVAKATADGGLSAEDAGDMSCTPPPLPCPAGYFSFNIDASGNLNIIYDQFPAPNDNSYGVNSVGWGKKTHTFQNLVGSDHAGFQLVDPGGVVRLSFNIDYLSALASAPSGYASLGPFGGDGGVVKGPLAPGDIAWTTSLHNNLNNINIPGLFGPGRVQLIGSVNVLVDSPPTDPAHETYTNSDPALQGWDFHNTYYVTISAAKLASLGFNSSWKVEPNLSALHNSPAKPCPPPAATHSLSVTKQEVKDKQVLVTVFNGGTVDEVVTALQLTWPATNGKLMQVKLDGDVIYEKPAISPPSANLTLAELVADTKKRRISKGTSDVLTLVFEKTASKFLGDYTGTLSTSGFGLTILP